ncbi:MAG: hypothetical protein AB7O31_00600 [Burkholderiales bacterium]
MRTLCCILVAAMIAGCAGMEPRAELTKEQVVELAKAGADANWIIERLRETDTVLWLSAADIIAMHRDGVPQQVLDWLQAEQIAEIRRRDAMFGSPYYHCPWPPDLLFSPLHRRLLGPCP